MYISGMRIPKMFNLLGLKIVVKMSDTLYHDSRMVGLAVYEDENILIQSNTGGKPRSKQSIDQTYLHELVHHILNAMGEYDLCKNEKFVDVFAGLLYQVEVTAKYT